MKFSTLFAATTLALSLTSGLAMAGAADDAIKARKACMKANGASMGTFVPMMKGEKPFDAAAVAAAVKGVETACADWAKWWGPETAKGEMEKTTAKAEIWTDAAGFTAANAAHATALTAVKAATDDATFKTAFAGFGGSCKGCHEKFRAAE